MSELKLNDEQDNGFQDGFINDVTFLYCCISEPQKKYKSEELEYSVKCVVDKATAKAFKKAYPKNGVKEVDTPDFSELYNGVEPPFPEQDEQYILTMHTSAEDKNGERLAYDQYKRPKVYVPAGKGVKDITKETLVANGSKGDVNFWVSKSDFGVFPKLAAVLVKELIVYEKKGNSGSAWGAVEGQEADPNAAAFSEQQKEDEPAESVDENF